MTMKKILIISVMYLILIQIILVNSAPIPITSSPSFWSSDKSVPLISSSNVNSSSTNNIPTKPTLSFPPLHCLKDSDCIGKNTSSKIFYDPNGRCDIRQNLCVCRESKRYKRVQIKVNVKTTTTASQLGPNDPSTINSANNHHPNNNHPQQTVLYVSKCILQDSNNNNNNIGLMDETVSIMIRSHYYGQPCDDDRQCSANMICRQLIINSNNKAKNNSTSTSTAAANLAQMLTANRIKRCRCPMGQHWNKYIRRCEWIHSNSLFQFGLAPSTDQQNYLDHHYGISSGNSLISGSFGSGLGPSVHQITTSNIDLKIFEIVLEIAFLVACLLGYKACSSICSKDDQNDSGSGTCNTDACYGSGDEHDSTFGGSGRDNGREIKSDEESILSSSVIKSSLMSVSNKTSHRNSVQNLMKGSSITEHSTNYSFKNKRANSVKTARRMSRKRRMSRFCARATARRNSASPYAGLSLSSGYYTNQNFRRLSSISASAMSRSSSASTRNLLVKINPSDANTKCLSVSTILAPPNSSNNNGRTGSSSRTSSPCYNCRIYKEVYSPSARCKSCRSSLLSVIDTSTVDLTNDHHQTSKNNNSLIDFDSLMLMVSGEAGGGGNSQHGSTDRLSPSTASSTDSNNVHQNNKSSILLPLPYKQKPIRRSEEVGVPPHLRAPYRDLQPFWLK